MKIRTTAEARRMNIVWALSALVIPLCGTSHARDWYHVDNVPNGEVSVDTGSLRSDGHQIETRVRLDGIGHSILMDGIRAGSIVWTTLFDCNTGMSADKIVRYYSLVGGTGTLLKCSEVIILWLRSTIRKDVYSTSFAPILR
jgi:hypothetical protein